MIAPTRFDPDRAERYRAEGWWAGDLVGERFEAVASEHGDRVVITDGEPITYRDLEMRAACFAGALAARGIGPGDVISFQLPNWWETAVVMLAAAKLGAAANPLQMIYRQAEIHFILAQSSSKAIVVPGTFRGTDYGAIAADVCARLEPKPLVISTRAPGALRVDQMIDEGVAASTARVSPDDVFLLMYTSGTTSAPKGVLHTHNTLLRAGQDLVELFHYHEHDKVYMPSPVTHVTGLLLGFIAPWLAGAGTVLDDHWEPAAALQAIVEHGCTFTGGATTFLRGYIDAAPRLGLSAGDIPLEKGPCGGADVPPTVIYDAADALGARFTRIYGATEGVTVTGTARDQPFERAAETDGRALPGYDVRVVDQDGNDAPVGVPGEILVRGPANFVGYFDRDLNAATFTPDSFIRMGDLGAFDADGYIRIHGRLKDIIIRHGENISAKEVEDLLVTHPAIAEIAIVAVPDPDAGERACAYVVSKDAAALTVHDLREHLTAAQIAKQKYPEYVVMVDELPKTASGKVQKFKLREDARHRELRVEPR